MEMYGVAELAWGRCFARDPLSGFLLGHKFAADSFDGSKTNVSGAEAVSSFDPCASSCVKAAVGWDHEEPMAAAAAEPRCSCA